MARATVNFVKVLSPQSGEVLYQAQSEDFNKLAIKTTKKQYQIKGKTDDEMEVVRFPKNMVLITNLPFEG